MLDDLVENLKDFGVEDQLKNNGFVLPETGRAVKEIVIKNIRLVNEVLRSHAEAKEKSSEEQEVQQTTDVARATYKDVHK